MPSFWQSHLDVRAHDVRVRLVHVVRRGEHVPGPDDDPAPRPSSIGRDLDHALEAAGGQRGPRAAVVGLVCWRLAHNSEVDARPGHLGHRREHLCRDSEPLELAVRWLARGRPIHTSVRKHHDAAAPVVARGELLVRGVHRALRSLRVPGSESRVELLVAHKIHVTDVFGRIRIRGIFRHDSFFVFGAIDRLDRRAFRVLETPCRKREHHGQHGRCRAREHLLFINGLLNVDYVSRKSTQLRAGPASSLLARRNSGPERVERFELRIVRRYTPPPHTPPRRSDNTSDCGKQRSPLLG